VATRKIKIKGSFIIHILLQEDKFKENKVKVRSGTLANYNKLSYIHMYT
jgi:hypothetical protein